MICFFFYSFRAKSNPGSLKTRASNRTKSSRSKRKQELKKYSTKEGSKYEDLGLMAAMHDLMTLTYKSTLTEVGALSRALVKCGFKAQAKRLQLKAIALDSEFKNNEKVIWNPKWIDHMEDEALKYGPQATTEDVINRANQDIGYKPELSILEPKFRFPPPRLPNNDWILQTLL